VRTAPRPPQTKRLSCQPHKTCVKRVGVITHLMHLRNANEAVSIERITKNPNWKGAAAIEKHTGQNAERLIDGAAAQITLMRQPEPPPARPVG